MSMFWRRWLKGLRSFGRVPKHVSSQEAMVVACGRSAPREEFQLEPKFPMYVVGIEDFLQMPPVPRPHQQLVAEGTAVVFDGKRICIFVSHQWVSRDFPGPYGEQLMVLREALAPSRSAYTDCLKLIAI